MGVNGIWRIPKSTPVIIQFFRMFDEIDHLAIGIHYFRKPPDDLL